MELAIRYIVVVLVSAVKIRFCGEKKYMYSVSEGEKYMFVRLISFKAGQVPSGI